MKYVGRFAPSPSGHLHFGSFVTALGSYLQAKANNGEWLVRIEDIDPPREMLGATSHILSTLEKLGLYWDRDVLYQSMRSIRYQEIIRSLLQAKHAYYCDCSRQRIHSLTNGHYDNYCRERALAATPNKQMAIRLKQINPIKSFVDNIRSRQTITNSEAQEDFIIHRKDGLFAYNLAVVIDDHDQGVTEIVRGADLLPVTTKQISLYKLLGWKLPSYYHLPLALNNQQNKLSKQNHAPEIQLNNINQLIIDGLAFLGQPTPKNYLDMSKEQLLNWAIQHWNIQYIPKKDLVINDID